VSDTPTPRTDSSGDWPSPEHTQRIQFEGWTCAVMAPEDYEALYKHAQQLERELNKAHVTIGQYHASAQTACININKLQSKLIAHKAALEKCHELLTKITQGHFYQSSCRGGEMERLMNQAIQSVSAVNHNQSSQ